MKDPAIESKADWVSIDPSFLAVPAYRNGFVKTAHKIEDVLKKVDPSAWLTDLQKLRAEVLSDLRTPGSNQDNIEVQLSTSVLFDLVEQGWKPKVVGSKVSLKRPVYHENALLAKEQIRRTLTLEREEQLAQPAVREFVETMQVRRLGPKGWVSVYSLMRDGEELAVDLKKIAALPDLTARTEALRSVVKPYLQFVTEDSICEHTGFRLMDIWRYFRLTWTTAYKSTPGRRMMILVRDAGAPFHPVMGIAGLSSAVMQLTRRDEWIGWYGQTFLANLAASPSDKSARWLLDTLDGCFNQIMLADIIREKVVSKAELKRPTRETIGRLLDDSEKAIKHHRLYPRTSDIKALQQKGSAMSGVQWKKLAKAPLFRAKRARALASLLKVRMAFREAGFIHPTKEALALAIPRGSVKTAIASLLRIVKAENVGTDIMDISVCGGVAPYNSILSGKLVSMLMASPEVVKEVKRRYSKTPSVIASAMKGKAEIRKPHLVLLGTTSLYHVGSSQYNRIRVEASQVGGVPGKSIEFIPLGETVGYGSFHFRAETLALIESFVARSMQNRRVNSIFGEGVSPRLRKIRQGLGAIGLSGDLLRHGTPRLVYMLPLADNFRSVLLGLSSSPKYFLPPTNPKKSTELIAEYWRRRWLAGRIEREGVLDAVSSHSLAYPVRHGARIVLPTDVLSDEPGDGDVL